MVLVPSCDVEHVIRLDNTLAHPQTPPAPIRPSPHQIKKKFKNLKKIKKIKKLEKNQKKFLPPPDVSSCPSIMHMESMDMLPHVEQGTEM